MKGAAAPAHWKEPVETILIVWDPRTEPGQDGKNMHPSDLFILWFNLSSLEKADARYSAEQFFPYSPCYQEIYKGEYCWLSNSVTTEL